MGLAFAFPHAGFGWRGVANHGHLTSAACGVLILGLAVVVLSSLVGVGWLFVAGLACGVAGTVLWWLQVDALLQQNRPALARLVPGHVAALRRSLVLQWLLHTLVWTSVSASITQWRMAPLIAGGLGLGLFCLVWLIRQPWLWVAGPVAVAALAPWGRAREALQAVLAAWVVEPQLSLPWVALLLLALALLLRGALQSGDGAHRRAAERRDRLRQMSQAMSRGGSVPVRLQTGLLGRLNRVYDLPWRWLLNRSLRPGQAPGGIGRLNLVLAGSSHWARQAAVLLLLLLVFGVPLAVLGASVSARSAESALVAMRFGLCIAVFGMALNPLVQLGNNLLGKRREQGLLMLAPGVPQGRTLAERWSRYLAVQFVLGWALATALVLLPMLAWAPVGAQNYTAGFAAGCLPLLAMVWRDWARLPSGGLGGQGPAVGTLVLGSVSGGLCEALELPPAASLGGALLLTLGLALLAWQRHRALPAPWPAGRL